jgi:putative DNA primase/helicase
MELFRGYVKTKNKACLQKFANGEKLLTLEQAKKLNEYAGIIANDVILVDIDDEKQSEILMDIVEDLQLNCRVYKTTRGKHFYFKNDGVRKCGTHLKLACGLEADIKLGNKNSYAILKYDNKERFIEWEEINNTLDPLPKFLLPVKTEIDFLNMERGDGRNQSLFNYILTLQKFNISKDEIKKTLKIINHYILKEPLAKSELETIMRDEAFLDVVKENFYGEKGKFRFDEFAKFLTEKHQIVKINGQLHIYQNGIYKVGYDEIQRVMIKHISDITERQRIEVLKYLNLLIDEDCNVSDAEFIAFKNGIYNIDTGDFMDFSPDIMITNKINFNYNPNAYSEIADKTLNKLACQNNQIRMLLDEVIGYCFYRRNELRKAFILTGDKHNGKSTYLDMITQLLGSENTVALDLKELGERFKTALLFGKLANIGDDIGDEFIGNPAIFKKVVSGDRINAEHKGMKPFDFAPYAKQLFSANTIPRIKDKSGAVLDRLIIVPFEAQFTRTDPDFDPYIKYKLRDESVMEYLIQIGLKGLRRVLDNQGFTISNKVVENLKEYAENNNPILLFFKEVDENEIMDKPTKYAYQRYSEFCLSNNFQQLSNIEFSRQIKKHLDCEIAVAFYNGKTSRIFKRKDI